MLLCLDMIYFLGLFLFHRPSGCMLALLGELRAFPVAVVVVGRCDILIGEYPYL